MTVLIAGGKIHSAVDSRGVLSQRPLNGAHAFDEFAPVHGAQETQAPDAVAYGNLIGRLLLIF